MAEVDSCSPTLGIGTLTQPSTESLLLLLLQDRSQLDISQEIDP